MSESDTEPVDTTNAEDAEILLADPNDYHQTQRLKEIHDARRRVHKVLDEINRHTVQKEHDTQRAALADAVAAYVTEIEPLIHKTEFDPSLPDGLPWDDLMRFADTLGHTFDTDDERGKAHYQESIYVFRQCNQFLSKVKPLITEDDTDEWEI